jgi:hypothetical protein
MNVIQTLMPGNLVDTVPPTLTAAKYKSFNRVTQEQQLGSERYCNRATHKISKISITAQHVSPLYPQSRIFHHLSAPNRCQQDTSFTLACGQVARQRDRDPETKLLRLAPNTLPRRTNRSRSFAHNGGVLFQPRRYLAPKILKDEFGGLQIRGRQLS